MLETLWNSRVNCIAVILFAVGFATLLLHRNLFKKILGLTVKLYERYHTLDLDEIYMIARQEEGKGEKA